MGLWDSLFGKKVVITTQDGNRKTISKSVPTKQLDQWEADDKVQRLPMVEVHMLDPKGSHTTQWEVGKDVPQDVVAHAIDPESGCLYAMTYYEAGKGKMVVMTKAKWLAAKKAMGE